MRKIFFFLILTLFIFILDSFSILSPIHKIVDIIIVPIKTTIWTTKVTLLMSAASWQKLGSMSKLSEELNNLRRESKENKVIIEALTAQNSDLRKQLESPLPASFHFIVAPVLGVSQTMDVAVGSSSGVKEGMSVVVGATLVGKVVRVSTDRSSVMLLKDPDMHIKVQTQKGTHGEVGGILGDLLKMEAVLQKDMLLQQDLIQTLGTDGVPPDLIIGSVSKIQSDDVAVYKMAGIVTDVDPRQLKIVYIISRT